MEDLQGQLTVRRTERKGSHAKAVGDGDAVEPGDTVSVHYLGSLVDGTVFDTSWNRGRPFTTQIGVGMVIQGWDQGVMQMSLGEKAKLEITSDFGYGPQGAGGVIPPNADLNFEVELLAIGDQKAPVKSACRNGYGRRGCLRIRWALPLSR